MEGTLNCNLVELLSRKDYYAVVDYITDVELGLLDGWYALSVEDFRFLLKKETQECEYAKRINQKSEDSLSFLLGKLEGSLEVYSALLHEEEVKWKFIKETATHSEKAKQILNILYRAGENGVRHGELADAIGSTNSSLTNIMKRMLKSGAINAARSGRNTFYKLNSTGKHFWEQQQITPENVLDTEKIAAQIADSIISELIKKSVQPASAQSSQVTITTGDYFVPIVNGIRYTPMRVERALKEKENIYADLSNELNQEKGFNGSPQKIPTSNCTVSNQYTNTLNTQSA